MSNFPHLERLIADAARLGPARAAVAYPHSAAALEAAVEAKRNGVIAPVLIGSEARIRGIANQHAIGLDGVTFLETGEAPIAAAIAAVALARDGKADVIMKGSLHTDELLGAVVAKDGGLRTGRRISHAFYFDVPGHAKPLMMADCVVNISPDLMVKRDIVQNAIDLAHALGVAKPMVALLSAVETINPAIPGTIEAAALAKMAERGQITGAVVDGPLAFDNAISRDAARIKGIVSPVAGESDILIVPNLEAGNMLYKQLVYLGRADCAGVILGTTVPIILTSRADFELVSGRFVGARGAASALAQAVLTLQVAEWRQDRSSASVFSPPQPHETKTTSEKQMKHVCVIQHTQSEWLGAIEDHLEGRGIRFSYFRPFTTDGRLPDVATLGDGLILLGGGPWGTATKDRLLPTLDAEVRLARACLMLEKPVIGFGLGSQILSLAAEGGVAEAPLTFDVHDAIRVADDALGRLLPRRFPNVVYMRDRPLPPEYGTILARAPDNSVALFQIGSNAFGFTGHPGIRRAMVEDLIMESDDSPVDPGVGLTELTCLVTALEDALVPIMTGLVAAAGWMSAH